MDDARASTEGGCGCGLAAREAHRAADAGDRMQMGAIAIGVATQQPAGEPVEGVVAEGLAILGGGQRARGDGCASAGRRAYRACPGEAIEIVVAEPLHVGPGRQRGRLTGDVAQRVVGRRLLKQRRPVAGLLLVDL